jgi:succinoglycan biosynthesis transport protein ExoP
MSSAREQQGEVNAELRRKLRTLARQKWLVLGCALVVGAVAVGYSALKEPMYEATARVLVRQDQLDPREGVGAVDPERQSATDVALAEQTALADRVRRELDVDASADELAAQVTPSAQGNASLIAFTAVDPVPAVAQKLANAFARDYTEFRADLDRRRIERGIASVQSRLNLLTAGDDPEGSDLPKTAAVEDLRDQIRELERTLSLQIGAAEVVQRAGRPVVPSGAGLARNVVIGLFFGTLLGIGLALLRDSVDRRVRTEDDLRALLPDIPIVADLPGWGAGARSWESAIEGYRTLQTNLSFLGDGAPLRSILITSPLQRDGKTTTAVNLALAIEEHDQSVILVDGDLRGGGLSEKLGFEDEDGLSNLLINGESRFDDFLRDVSMRSSGAQHVSPLTGNLTVLPSGPIPPNPQALLSRSSLDEVIDQATIRADRLIIDGAPVGPVSDMLPVARRVEGVLLVVRLLHSRADDIGRLIEALGRVGVRPVGIVLYGAAEYVGYRGYGRPLRGNDALGAGVASKRRRSLRLWAGAKG